MALWNRKKGADAPPVTTPEGRPDAVPPAVLPELGRREQVLASAREDAEGRWLVLTTWRLLERSQEGTTTLERPWHEIDTGAWDPDRWTLSVIFVDGLHGRQWRLQHLTGPGQVPEVFRDRVNATVLLTRAIDLGPRRTARVSIRKELSTRELVEQVILGHGSRAEDADLAARVLTARTELREQTGMAPMATSS